MHPTPLAEARERGGLNREGAKGIKDKYLFSL